MAERITTGGARISIREWAPDDRPREKLMEKGPRALSDAELMAILIRTGTARQNALELARTILRDVDGDLDRLGKLSVGELMKVEGIKEAKALTIAAALEIGRRRKELPERARAAIRSSADAFSELHPLLRDLGHEQFWLLFLDRGCRMIRRPFMLSEGGMHGTVADPKLIFKHALEQGASCIVLAHNHPSGQLRPSEEDIQLTRKLVEGGRLLDLAVQDHLIVATHGYFSFADQGML
jgi:DNA repair protein RadC